MEAIAFPTLPPQDEELPLDDVRKNVLCTIRHIPDLGEAHLQQHPDGHYWCGGDGEGYWQKKSEQTGNSLPKSGSLQSSSENMKEEFWKHRDPLRILSQA